MQAPTAPLFRETEPNLPSYQNFINNTQGIKKHESQLLKLQLMLDSLESRHYRIENMTLKTIRERKEKEELAI